MARPGFFGWFQIVCLGFFVVTIVARTINLLVHRKINPITLSLGKRGLLGVMEISLFAGVNLWTAAVLFYALPIDVGRFLGVFGVRLIDSLLVRIAGVLMIAAAFGVFALSLVALGDSWRLGIDERRPGELVTRGIYALSRNPIYLFFDLYFLGTFLVNGALVFLVFALLAMGNLHYQMLEEERFLARVHGPAYESYRQRTGRYFTWQHVVRRIGLWIRLQRKFEGVP